jgi:hypothetical protein
LRLENVDEDAKSSPGISSCMFLFPGFPRVVHCRKQVLKLDEGRLPDFFFDGADGILLPFSLHYSSSFDQALAQLGTNAQKVLLWKHVETR